MGEISARFDIATGYFEIGALLALNGKWEKLDQIRILVGDEVTKCTQRAFKLLTSSHCPTPMKFAQRAE